MPIPNHIAPREDVGAGDVPALASARGLFRSTGKAGKVDLPRRPRDFYPTPTEPTAAFVQAERCHLEKFSRIWEPAAGDGAMLADLRLAGFDVHASDIHDAGCGAEIRDFFDFVEAPARAMVTNPPYSKVNHRDGKGRWIWHALETLGLDYMALLLSWNWPGAAGHADLLERFPPQRVYLMRWRIDWTDQGGPPQLNAWFVWDRFSQRRGTELLMLDRLKVK